MSIRLYGEPTIYGICINTMLDIKFIRDNSDIVKEAVRKKRLSVDIDELLRLDDARKELQQTYDAHRAKQNEASQRIASAPTPEARQQAIDSVQSVKSELQKAEEELKTTLQAWQKLMVQVPNVPDMSVPEGDSDADNQEIRTWGSPRRFSFEPKSHIELLEGMNGIDLERGVKVAGFRGYFLRGDGARLEMALWRFAQDHLEKKGFDPMIVPSLVRREPFIGTGYLPQGEEDLYKTQDDEYLAGTGEVATMAYHMDEVLEADKLPIKYLAFSTCFRREAGSHGKDTKGLVRVHEFYKLEQVVLCEASHQTSVEHHEALTRNTEEILEALELPYRTVVNCSGDLGLGQVKKYDLEAWVPSEKKYRETHSSSYFHDFQTRRLNIRYRDKDGALRFVHSLNNTAVATPRLLVPILENHQKPDGTIRVPEALQPYLGKELLGTHD